MRIPSLVAASLLAFSLSGCVLQVGPDPELEVLESEEPEVGAHEEELTLTTTTTSTALRCNEEARVGVSAKDSVECKDSNAGLVLLP